jgi:gamma-glutamyl phosphate reductase
MVEHFKDVGEYRNQIIGDAKYFAVSDFRKGIVTIDNSAKQYLANDESIRKRRYMDIVVVSNWATKMEAQLYLKFFKPKVKTKVVKSLEEAIEAVERHKKKHQLAS